MKTILLIAVLVIASVMAITTNFTKTSYSGSQNISLQFNVKDIPEYGLNIITPASPKFDNLTASRFGKNNPVINALQPFSALIKNTGKQTVVAYSLKWELTRNDGKVFTQIRNYITFWELIGMKGKDDNGDTIRPNSFAFVTPTNLNIPQSAEATSTIDPAVLASINDITRELSEYTSITVTLDGVFFDDATYIGADTTGFFAKVEALRNAKRDLYLETVQAINRGDSVQQALKHIEDIANEPSVILSSSPTQADLYKKYKKDAAIELIRMRTASGETQPIEYATQLLNNKWPELRKR
jgi:hypothetical protein